VDLLSSIPAEIISRRAVECKSYSRALFHWEQHIRQIRESLQAKADDDRENDIRDGKDDKIPRETAPVPAALLQRLQDIYSQIDEPDGIEGISVRLPILDMDQQVIGHRKAGRWTAVQSWYEIKLEDEPENVEVQANLLSCLKELGQHGMLFLAT
jgi:serine/threonine-protein kinase ATR